jgi:DnaJ-class molecular chaperone
MAKSYFAILGVTSGASADEIRSAYRRLAKEFHPDHYAGGSEPFRQVQEAYAVLGNSRKRKVYQNSLAEPVVRVTRRRSASAAPEPEPLIPEDKPVDLGDISPIRSFQQFAPSRNEIFDWLWDNFSDVQRSKSGSVQNLTLEVTLSREQARQGGIAKVMVPAQASCPTCRGHGGVGPYECMRCAGEGAISGEVPVSISFPPGITQDHAVMVPLARFGIRNLHLTVLFRPRDTQHI